MTCWWWVRHGPTHANGMVGWTDLPADLSDTAALARLEAYLPDDAVMVSSDLSRCVATADAVQGGRERLEHAHDIREIHFGDWEDKTFQQAAETHPELTRAYWSEPGDIAAPKGESWNDVATRVGRYVDDMNVQYAGRNVIAVAHLGVILTQLQRAVNMAPSAALSFTIDNLSVTRLEFMGEAWRVLGVNHRP